MNDSSAFALRRAVSSDAEAIVTLVNSAYRGDTSRAGWTTEADLLGGQRVDDAGIRAAIADSNNVILLHEHAGQLLACVQLDRLADGCYLGMLTIEPQRQAAGLGRQLLQAAEEFAKTQWHCQRVEMTVIGLRSELIAWYERRGYRRTGQSKPFPYGDARFGLPRRDDLVFVVLEKFLTSPGR
jgi:GNAT superfamily N-acetyltransferase